MSKEKYDGLLTSTTIWCSCDSLKEYVPIDQDWHGEQIKMKCENCGHIINVERSLVTPMKERMENQ